MPFLPPQKDGTEKRVHSPVSVEFFEFFFFFFLSRGRYIFHPSVSKPTNPLMDESLTNQPGPFPDRKLLLKGGIKVH